MDDTWAEHYAIRLPYSVHALVPVFLSVSPTYCHAALRFPPNELIVTHPAAATVSFHAQSCDKSICVPTGKATEALVGTVRVIAEAFVRVTVLPISVSTSVYVVPVCALITFIP